MRAAGCPGLARARLRGWGTSLGGAPAASDPTQAKPHPLSPASPVLNEQHRLVRVGLDIVSLCRDVVHDKGAPQAVRILGKVVGVVPVRACQCRGGEAVFGGGASGVPTEAGRVDGGSGHLPGRRASNPSTHASRPPQPTPYAPPVSHRDCPA